jgi:hypothetical protein
MSSDRSRRPDVSKGPQREGKDISIDLNADEALRAIVRVLAREAARELYASSSMRHEGEDAPKGPR